MRKIRRKIYTKEFGPTTRECRVYFSEIYNCDFLDDIKNFEIEFKKSLINETFIKVEDALGCVLIDTDEIEKFLKYCEEDEVEINSKTYQNYRNLPEETINPHLFKSDLAYRDGVIDALKMFKLEVLCTMKECQDSFEEASEELDK